MRLAARIAQVVIVAARSRVIPVENGVDLLEPLRFRADAAGASELLFEPEPIVKRYVKRVEVGAAADVDRLVTLDAELHANALEERLGELVNARPPIRGDALGHGA